MKTLLKLILLAVALFFTTELIGRVAGELARRQSAPIAVKNVTVSTEFPPGESPTSTPARAEPRPHPPTKPVMPQSAPRIAPEKPTTTPMNTQAPHQQVLTIPLPVVPAIVSDNLTDQEIYTRYANAVVQVFCANDQTVFSASGIIVNERGLVLTNAHVADIVKKVGEANCQARHGNPADPFAGLIVLYEPDTTLKIAGTQVSQRDFAFLKLTNATAPFAFAPIELADMPQGTTLLTLGYPSEFLQSIAASSNSNLVFSTLTVGDIGDIDGDTSTAEAYIFHGGLALQEGSSGTALFTRSGKIAGLFFATTKAATTAERDGFALMTSYIDRIMRLETGKGLTDFITAN